MAKAKTTFAAIPLRAIGDKLLTGLDWRVLACVSWHDRMSAAGSKCGGCYASNVTLSREVGCEYSALSRSISRLVDAGYLTREKSARMTVYRVVFEDPDSLPTGKLCDADRFANEQSDGTATVCRKADDQDRTVCRGNSENGRNPPRSGSQYIPLRGVINNAEACVINSAEAARFASRDAVDDVYSETRSAAGIIAQLERDLASGPVWDLKKRAKWLDRWIENYDGEGNEPTYHRAMRVDEIVQYRLAGQGR